MTAIPAWIMLFVFLAACAAVVVLAVVRGRCRRGEVRGFEVRPGEPEDRGEG
jgi:hypothetical protein